MPLYEYHCRDCDKQVELLIRSSDETPLCPDCGGHQLMKLLSVPTAHTAESGSKSSREGPAGPCGSGCGCFPGG